MTELTNKPPLLSVRDLSLSIRSGRPYKLVDGISFDVPEGGVLGIVGESGCGKSVTALSLLRLTSPAIELSSGQILFNGEDIVQCSDERIRKVRGAEISMIFQEPMTSLNPVFTIGNQIVEAVQTHENLS